MYASKIAEKNPTDGVVKVYNVNDFGLKNLSPTTIIEKGQNNIKLYAVNEYGIKAISPPKARAVWRNAFWIWTGRRDNQGHHRNAPFR